MENEIKKSNAPLILGILSFFAWFIPLFGLPTTISGIVISAKNLKKMKCTSYKVGLGLSIFGLILTIINMVLGVMMMSKILG